MTLSPAMTFRPALAVLLTTLALLAHLLVPAGFMPQVNGGKIALTICHGADIKTVFVDADQAPEQAPSSKAASCPFALSAPPAPVANPPLIILALVAVLAVSLYILPLPPFSRSVLRRGFATRAPPLNL